MKSFTLILVLFVLALSDAHAALMETYDKLVERYGKPVDELKCEKPVTKAYLFHKDKFKIIARFIGDVVVLERYTLKDGGTLHKDQVLHVLAANSANFKWNREKERHWSRSDNNAWAREEDDETTIILWTTQWKTARKIDKGL